MKRWSLVSFIATIFLYGLAQPSESLQQMRVDIAYLASDMLEGREPGKQGELWAADYIATRLAQSGVKPAGRNGSWFQEFSFKYKSNPHAEAGEDRVGRNVVGLIDNGASSTVVIGAHYDHLGHGGAGSLSTEQAIHNGADDNASGVTCMLKLAEYLSKGKAKNNNYLFIGFSAEELGLVGSKYFVENPTISLPAVNYMINMDMVGRLNAERVISINGVGTSPIWKEVLTKITSGNLKVKTTDSGVGPSDHTSFYFKDIPVLHFFTGQHTDYHKPGDDAQLINYQGLHDVTDFIFALIEQINDKGKLVFTKTKDDEQGRQAAKFKVSLGVMPDYVYDGQGMRIDGVIEGKAAAKAGFEKGDVILKIGGVDVKDIYSYMEGLSKYQAGDKTIIVIRRGDQQLEKQVQF